MGGQQQGISMGGFGLSVRTEDIARFGQLYLQNGNWQGKPLVPAEWVADATSRHVSNGSSPTSDWEQGYGYQFWRARYGFYRGDGAHGQFCLVLPQHDTVIAITSGTRDMAPVMNLVWDRLVPALQAAPLPEDAAANRQLQAKLASLALPAETNIATADGDALVGKRYVFTSNAQAIESIALASADAAGRVTLSVRTAGKDQQVLAAPGSWQKGTTATGERQPAGGRSRHLYVEGRAIQHALHHDLPPALCGRPADRGQRTERWRAGDADRAPRGEARGRGLASIVDQQTSASCVSWYWRLCTSRKRALTSSERCSLHVWASMFHRRCACGSVSRSVGCLMKVPAIRTRSARRGSSFGTSNTPWVAVRITFASRIPT